MAINSLINVHCFWQAVSDKKGTLKVPTLEPQQHNNFGGLSLLESTASGDTVDVVMLNEVPSLQELNRLKLIKIDVEGMESHVLAGAKKLIKKHTPLIYVENDRKEKSKELIELLFSLGYKLFWHMPVMFNENNYAGDKENIFGDIISINMLCFPKEAETNLNGFVEVTSSADWWR